MKKIIICTVVFMASMIDAATFKVTNETDRTIEFRYVAGNRNYPDRGYYTLGAKTTSKNFDTGVHKVSQIEWYQNGFGYLVDLSSIKSHVMLNREFKVAPNGKYYHTFVSNFPLKYTPGDALKFQDMRASGN